MSTAGSTGQQNVVIYAIPGLILYPSLLTPEIITGSFGQKDIELLLLIHKDHTLSSSNIDYQVKINAGLNPAKSFAFTPLSQLDASVEISFQSITLDENVLITDTKFKGLLDSHSLEAFQNSDYTKLHKVSIRHSNLLSDGVNNLFWLCPADGVWHEIASPGITPDGASGVVSTHTLNIVENGRITPNEIQDAGIRNILTDLNGSNIAEGGKYCYRITDDDVDHTEVDLMNPIQAYHPVIYYQQSPEYLNLGHLTDIHLAARQSVLARCQARVIEYPFERDAPQQSAGEPPSSGTQSGDDSDDQADTQQDDSQQQQPYDIYVIVRGDWLSKIAARYGMTWQELWHYDGGTGIPNSRRLRSGDPDLIYPGEEIVVPPSSPPPQENPPHLHVSPSAVAIVIDENGASTGPKTITITNTGGGSLNWSAESADEWVSINPTSGTTTPDTPNSASVDANGEGKEPGTYQSSITISSAEADNSPQTVSVTLTIAEAAEHHPEDSPTIGSMIGVSTKIIKTLLDRIGGDPGIHALMMTGDLIDFNKMLYPDKTSHTVKQIWDQVALDDSYESRYQDYVDAIAMYTLMVYYYRRYQKPAFVMTGNHDAYALPYGISPRVLWVRANPGIPADHNLTIYEATLAFGETYDEIKEKGTFHYERLKWFYSVFTPFSDFAVGFPSQTIAGMAWGDEEDVLDFPGIDQGFGHLPRADDPVTDKQLQLLNLALADQKKLIFTSHFTFVSYLESIPMNTAEEGYIEYDALWNAADHDQGTFETNRRQLYEQKLVNNRSIQVILTGHSHRRGFYTVNRSESTHGGDAVRTSYFDFADYPAVKAAGYRVTPIVIVSDSAGPHPRLNKTGEFNGVGSDLSAGSKICFDASGEVSRMEAVPGSRNPRIAVAIDYYDLLENNPTIGHHDRVLEDFESDKFLIRDEHRGMVDYRFSFTFFNHVRNLVGVEDIVIYVYGADGEWKKIPMHSDGTRWIIQRGRDAQTFFNFVNGNEERSIFMSMKFNQRSPLVSHYDFDSRWNFEIQVDSDTSGGGLFGTDTHKQYTIERDVDRAEIPDYEWRRRFEKYQ